MRSLVRASQVVGFTRTVFPLTIALMAILAVFLYLVYGLAQSDYQGVCPGPPIYPRCADDLNIMAQIETLGVVCTVLMAGGLLLTRRFKGAFHLLSFVVLMTMLAYISLWFV